MKITALHENFVMPTKGTEQAGAFDIYMPEDGEIYGNSEMFGLGFAAAVPPGHVALLLPRSSTGAKYGLELNNSCGVIDSDYRGEWKAALRTKNGSLFAWNKGDRLLQFIVIPVANVLLEKVSTLDETKRGTEGFGSTGK
jgi:dUTP pyrophosphatase